jgi:hypothetical protein
MENSAYLFETLLLGCKPIPKVCVLQRFRKEPVDDDRVNYQSIEAEVHESPLSLSDDHSFRIGHQPYGSDFSV